MSLGSNGTYVLSKEMRSRSLSVKLMIELLTQEINVNKCKFPYKSLVISRL